MLTRLKGNPQTTAEVEASETASGTVGDGIGQLMEERKRTREGAEVVHLRADVDVQPVDG